jgi:diguanylate cyclase (GGDEF)-like protein
LRRYRSDIEEVTAWLAVERHSAQLPSERAVLRSFAGRWKSYRSGNERAFRLSRRGFIVRARATYISVSYAPLLKSISLYENLIQGQINDAEARRVDLSRGAQTAAALLGEAALVLAILIAVGIGGSLRRRLGVVSNSIREVVRADLPQLANSFQNIASGDFRAPRYVCARRRLENMGGDELGSLAECYNDLTDALRDMGRRIDQAVLDARRSREAEERLAYLQRYDEVTGIPNRELLHLELDHALRTARSGASLAVVYIGLVAFDKVTNSFGRAAAEQVLRFAATRLCANLGRTDMCARGRADDFIMVFDPVNGREDAVQRARRLFETALSRPFSVEGQEVLLSASAGVAVHPYDGYEADDLIRNAHTAMSSARETGTGEIVAYAPEMRTQSLERLTMEFDLQRALGAGEFELHYQPIVNVAARRIDSFEALLRWRHPRLGLLDPGAFIDIAESSGAIETLGTWVLETACEQTRKWQSQGHEVGVSVNVSMRQFRGDLFKIVESVLSATRLPPESLELELTETLILTDRPAAAAALSSLKHLGVRVAIDDFGTGYSSFAYLRSFPLDAVKIDRSFINDITTKAFDEAIARAIILLARSLGIGVIAEGVEHVRQVAALHKLGCDVMQGYFFGRPRPAHECRLLLANSAS